MKRPRNRNNQAGSPRHARHNEQNATQHTDPPAAIRQMERPMLKPPVGGPETEEQRHRTYERGFGNGKLG